ncbi:hypothetical protein NicSoilB4_25900 [Arthrobacter sp. NicSoilB4]|uniref:hypothetical protein n=1 Tax=Arthrobacter sp. NicSoilB4 TaxID=2830997 RepID=UPI001CC4608D|nr:hypothetical protein [Arthrobacter sp. NicSoilB4]BCW67827.1 hypothetical protein NicSoilB4_25900 [Arthrobacter sp. NicSoilB4]
MRLLKRLLGCHDPRRRHLESCDQCQQQLRRERQYLERLRGAEVPSASGDLTARLLARTEELARGTDTGGTGRAHPRGLSSAVPGVRGFRPALRSALLVAGGAAAAAALLGGSAYVMGGDAAPQAGGAPASAFLQRDLASSAPAAVEAGAGTPAGWGPTGEPDFTPAGTLTAAQLATLRSEGWTCPELRELGYHLVWARGGVLAGVDVVELRLTDGRNFATIFEEHSGLPGQSGTPEGGPRKAPPVNVLTGRPATSDGFTSAAVPGGGAATGAKAETGGAAASSSGILWVNHGPPYAAIYQKDDATFTYVSDEPAERADDGVAALVHARSGAAAAAGDGAGSGAGHSFTARLERGLGRIMELLAP